MDHLDGTVFVDRLRGIKRDLIVRKIQKLKTTRQMVEPAPAADRLLRHAGVRGAVARGADRVARITSSAVVSQPDRPKGAGTSCSRRRRRQVAARARRAGAAARRSCETRRFSRRSRGLQPDLGVVAAYGRILPDALLAIPRLGMINVHASLLPHYRGAAPVQRAVLAGDAETGVTIMRVVSELDAGPMFATPDVADRRRTPRAATSKPRSRGSAPRCCCRSSTHLADGRRRRDAAGRTRGDAMPPKITKAEGADRLDAPGAARSTTRSAACSPGRWPRPTLAGDRAASSAAPRRAVGDPDDATSSRRRPGRSCSRTGDELHGGLRRGQRAADPEIQPEGRRAMTCARVPRRDAAPSQASDGSVRDHRAIAPARRRRTRRSSRSRPDARICRRRSRADARAAARTSATARWPARSRPARCAGRARSITSSHAFAGRPIDETRPGGARDPADQRLPAPASRSRSRIRGGRRRRGAGEQGGQEERAPDFVNALLRRVSRERTRLPLPPRAADRPAVDHALSHPRWLVDRWLAATDSTPRSAGRASTTRPRR